MARRRARGGGGHGEEGGGAERWLLTYADMITLLLALFIVLFAMSTIDPVRYEQLRRVLSQEFKGDVLTNADSVLADADGALDPSLATHIESSPQTLRTPASAGSPTQREKDAKLRADAEKVLESSGFKGKADVIVTQKGVVIRLENSSLFDSGSAELKPGARKGIARVTKGLIPLRRHIAVLGHSDGVPVSTGQYPSNWNLSSARAVEVGRFMISQGIAPGRMEMTGYADTRPIVQPPYRTADMPRNRRVEIVIRSGNSDETAAGSVAGSEVAAARPSRSGTPPPAPGAPDPVGVEDIVGPIVDLGGSR